MPGDRFIRNPSHAVKPSVPLEEGYCFHSQIAPEDDENHMCCLEMFVLAKGLRVFSVFYDLLNHFCDFLNEDGDIEFTDFCPPTTRGRKAPRKHKYVGEFDCAFVILSNLNQFDAFLADDNFIHLTFHWGDLELSLDQNKVIKGIGYSGDIFEGAMSILKDYDINEYTLEAKNHRKHRVFPVPNHDEVTSEFTRLLNLDVE